MRMFGAELAGSSRVLRRADLLRQLKKLRGRAAFRIETERRTRVVAELRQARLSGIGADRQAAPRRDPGALRLARRPPGAARESGRVRARPEARRDQGRDAGS